MSQSQLEWYKSENERLQRQVEHLIKGMHRIDTARQAAISMSNALASENLKLNEEIDLLKNQLLSMSMKIVDLRNEAFGERGEACLAIDGGNL